MKFSTTRRAMGMIGAMASLALLAACTVEDSGLNALDQEPTTPIPNPTPQDPTSTTEVDVQGDDRSFDDDLPRSARYGDIEFTVLSATMTDSPPEGFAEPEPEEAFAVLEVSAASLLEEYTWTVPVAGLMRLQVGDDDLEPRTTTAYSLQALKPEVLDVVFAVSSSTDLGEAILVIQEYATTPDDRRTPVQIPISGPAPTAEEAPVSLTFSQEAIRVSSIGDSVEFTVLSADLVENIGFRSNGGAWPGDKHGLRRARDGKLFLRVLMEGVGIDDTGVLCHGPLSPGAYAEDGEQSNRGTTVGSDVSGSMCPGAAPAEQHVVFEVPADRSTYQVNMLNQRGTVAGTFTFSR